MKKIIKYLTIALFAGIVSGCATANLTGDNTTRKADKNTTGFMNLVTKDDIEVNTSKAFANTDKVIIGGFKVGFNDNKEIVGKSRLLKGKTTGEVSLQGVDNETRQKIADATYEQFVQKLQDTGVNIVQRDLLLESPEYQDLKQVDFPFKHDYSGIFSSYGQGQYFSPSALGDKQVFFRDEIDASNEGLFGGLTSNSPGSFSVTAVSQAIQKFGERTNIPVINVTYLVDFASGGDAGFSISQLELGQSMAVNQGILGISKGYGGSFSTKNGNLKLGQPIQSDKTFATITDQTSTGTQVAEGAFNLIFNGGILGAAGIGGDHTKTYVFETDPEKFTAAATDALNQANNIFIDKFAELNVSAE